ncbi:MAG: hydroxymethylbilane synthase [Proteobacteria bacterium]|nr:hydroxymethylbilane synthase [Pseudomonadota bacterium]
MNKRKIRIGTRKSKLAMAQAQQVCAAIREAYFDWEPELVPITTQGDRFLNVPITSLEGKGIFLKEIEDALLQGEIDCAVHSVKDVPTELHPHLCVGMIMKREDARDGLIAGGTLANLARGSSIGTGSNRRKYQLLACRSDLQIKPVRGNVDTRIRKWQEGQYDALVMAMAGLKRMGLEHVVSQILPFETMLPAAGQGAIGIELRKRDEKLLERMLFLDDRDTHAAVDGERAFLQGVGGGCDLPAGIYGEVREGRLHLSGRIIKEAGAAVIEGKASGAIEDAQQIGKQLARELLKR